MLEIYSRFLTHLWGSLALTMIWTHSLLLKALSIHDFCACEETTTTKKSPHQSCHGAVKTQQTGRSESRQELCVWGSSCSAKQKRFIIMLVRGQSEVCCTKTFTVSCKQWFCYCGQQTNCVYYRNIWGFIYKHIWLFVCFGGFLENATPDISLVLIKLVHAHVPTW